MSRMFVGLHCIVILIGWVLSKNSLLSYCGLWSVVASSWPHFRGVLANWCLAQFARYPLQCVPYWPPLAYQQCYRLLALHWQLLLIHGSNVFLLIAFCDLQDHVVASVFCPLPFTILNSWIGYLAWMIVSLSLWLTEVDTHLFILTPFQMTSYSYQLDSLGLICLAC